ncbi:MAG: hypothetical protein KBD21_03675 [Candidatus Pacebacteria bacterium]|nr:hypothetical protein [Candidatus Paceibacterota bacterium]
MFRLTVWEWATLHTLSEVKGNLARNVLEQRVREKYPLLSHLISTPKALNSLYEKGYVISDSLSTYTLTDEGVHIYHTYIHAMRRVIS